MRFETEKPQPRPKRLVRDIGELTMRIDLPSESDRTWQHFVLSAGEFTDSTPNECQETWPKKVVTRLRAAADTLEALIREEEA